MSTGKPISWDDAFLIAANVQAALEPHVRRIQVVGSVRRHKPWVSDVEFLAEAKMVPVDLFGGKAPDVESVRAALEKLGTWVKGADRMLQITDVEVPGFKVEVYLIHPPAQWGSSLAIRTGPWDLGRHAMMELKKRGYGHDEGHAFDLRTKAVVETPDEDDFFKLAGLPCVPPHHRDALMKRLEATP